MKPIAFLALLASLFVFVTPALAPAAPQITGTWNFVPAGSPGRTEIELRYSGECRAHGNCDHNTSVTLALSQLGLSQWAVSQPMHRAMFAMHGDAGTIAFSGTIGGGLGVGRFTFTPSSAYAEAVQRYGVAAPSEQDQLGALLLAVSLAYVRDIEAAGVHESSLRMFIAFRALDVTPEYLAALARVGYAHLSTHDVLSFKALHIDAAFVRAMRVRGYAHPSPEELIRLKALQ